MGFWDKVGSVAKGAMNSIEAHNAEVHELTGRFRDEDESWLRRKLTNGSTAEKMAAAKVLKERGLGPTRS